MNLHSEFLLTSPLRGRERQAWLGDWKDGGDSRPSPPRLALPLSDFKQGSPGRGSEPETSSRDPAGGGRATSADAKPRRHLACLGCDGRPCLGSKRQNSQRFVRRKDVPTLEQERGERVQGSSGNQPLALSPSNKAPHGDVWLCPGCLLCVYTAVSCNWDPALSWTCSPVEARPLLNCRREASRCCPPAWRSGHCGSRQLLAPRVPISKAVSPGQAPGTGPFQESCAVTLAIPGRRRRALGLVQAQANRRGLHGYRPGAALGTHGCLVPRISNFKFTPCICFIFS